MRFYKSLQKATLQLRYKRFLADVVLPDGQEMTLHCPNTGAMTGCAEPGMTVWYSDSENLKRKYRYTLELTQTSGGQFICVNTQHANKLAGEILSDDLIPGLSGLTDLQRERRYGEQNSRIDWFGTDTDGRSCFVEVKSVTLCADNEQGQPCGYFPDTRSDRARKHVQELTQVALAGHRAAVLYIVMHDGIDNVQSAQQIDPKYAELCLIARQAGVEFYAFKCKLSAAEIVPLKEIPVISGLSLDFTK